jgi:hypothetical protein
VILGLQGIIILAKLMDHYGYSSTNVYGKVGKRALAELRLKLGLWKVLMIEMKK